jgi:outer membrane protein assembly factor BamA
VSFIATWLGLTLLLGSIPPHCTDESRAAQWTCARQAKAGKLVSATKPVEAPLSKIEKVDVGFTEDEFGIAPEFASVRLPREGLRVLAGGLSPESSLAAGADYSIQEVFRPRFDFRVSGRWSTRAYQRYVAEAAAPRFFSSRSFLESRAIHRRYPQEDFYGVGPDSSEANRSDYSLDATDAGAALGVRLAPSVRVRGFGGVLNTRIGPGKDTRLPSVEELFHSDTPPGLLRNVDYRYAGAAIDADYRDDSADPKSGGYYQAAWTSLSDRTPALLSFQLYSVELRQYLKLWDRNRVLAFRFRTDLTDPDGDGETPFFLMPALGGPETLRSFPDARFRDRNMLLMNAEYRWTVFTQMDAVLFADAGKVFPRLGEFGLNRLESSYGFGVRFKTPKGPLFRVEFGFNQDTHRLSIAFLPAF